MSAVDEVVLKVESLRVDTQDGAAPLLTLFGPAAYAVYDSKAVIAQGGTSGKDATGTPPNRHERFDSP